MGLRGAVPTSDFYDRWTDLFHRGFGTVFQAGMLPTGDPPREDPVGSVLALARRAGVSDGDRILDAGCGIAGPASIIASHYPEVSIDGVTNSPRQVDISRRLLDGEGQRDRVRVHLGDYHSLPFDSETFDVVMFLESTGYAEDIDRLYGEAGRVLRPGGRLYVKDVFCVGSQLAPGERSAMEAFDQLWGCVRSRTISESQAAITNAGLLVTKARELVQVGTARLAGAMFTLDQSIGLRATDLGRQFSPRGMSPPIEFGEILAIKPSPP